MSLSNLCWCFWILNPNNCWLRATVFMETISSLATAKLSFHVFLFIRKRNNNKCYTQHFSILLCSSWSRTHPLGMVRIRLMYVRSSSSGRRLRTHECLRCHSSIIKLHHALWGCRLERREPGEVYLGSLPSSPPFSQTVIDSSLSAFQVPFRI